MPLSKPVKRQVLCMPHYNVFVSLSQKKKREILSLLSIDNLVRYIEYIINGHHSPPEQACSPLDQIAEDDFRAAYGNANFNNIVTDFIQNIDNDLSVFADDDFLPGDASPVSQISDNAGIAGPSKDKFGDAMSSILKDTTSMMPEFNEQRMFSEQMSKPPRHQQLPQLRSSNGQSSNALPAFSDLLENANKEQTQRASKNDDYADNFLGGSKLYQFPSFSSAPAPFANAPIFSAFGSGSAQDSKPFGPFSSLPKMNFNLAPMNSSSNAGANNNRRSPALNNRHNSSANAGNINRWDNNIPMFEAFNRLSLQDNQSSYGFNSLKTGNQYRNSPDFPW